MTEEATTPTMTKPASRITHLDTIRGVAVLGILLMNIVSYAYRGPAYFDISLPEGQAQLDWLLAALAEVFADQKFMALFSMLFGASVLLFLERAELKSLEPVKLSLWRNFLLLMIGLIHASIWEGDILTVYALCSPFLLAVRRLSASSLMVLGSVVYGSSALYNYLMAALGPDQVIRDVWTALLPTPEHELVGLVFIMDAISRSLGMMMVGMGLYKSGYLLKPEAAMNHRRLAALCILCGGLASTLGILWVHQNGYDAHSILIGNIANTLGTIPMALGYLTWLMAWDTQSKSRLMPFIRGLGQSALSNYLGQSLVCLTVLGLAEPATFMRSTLLLLVIGIWCIQLLVSPLWLRRYRYGPLEWLWRCATYRRLEPLRRSP